jgi:cytochrome P450
MPPKFLRLQFFADWFPLASHALFAMDADIVKDMFNSAAESAVIKGNSYRLAYPLIGDGILALPMNEKWKTQRRLTEHAFRLENLKYSHAQINKVLVRMLDRWNARYAASKAAGTSDSLTSLPSDPALAKKQGWFDIRHDMLRVTMDIICQVGFGRDYEAGAEKEHLLQQERETFTAVSLKSKLEGPEASKDGEPLYRVFNEILVKMANRARILPFAYMFTEDDRGALPFFLPLTDSSPF